MKYFFTVLLLIVATCAFSQVVNWEPGISYTWKKGEQWAYNIKAESRSKIYDETVDYNFRFYEAEFYITRKFFNENKLTGGYMFRHEDPFEGGGFAYEHRFMQQFTFISFLRDNRLGHRIRTEQRVKHDEFENRVRYRLSYDFPLSGQSLNPGEKYLILSNEGLTTFNTEEFSVSNRFYVGLGWYFSSKQKFESGLEGRYSDIGAENNVLIHVVTTFYINQ